MKKIIQASLFENQPEKQESARYKWLLQLIARHNHLYHTLDKPEISDEEYDSLYKELFEFEEKYPQFIDKNSPTKKVGSTLLSSLEQRNHRTRMYGLDNVFDKEEYIAFVQKMKNIEAKGNFELFADLKLDGLACELVYERGKLVLALTRGDGISGEDITHAARLIQNIPQNLTAIDIPDLLEVRGEVLFFKEDFKNLNAQQEALGQQPFKNARNAAAGTLRQLDLKKIASRPLRFMAYSTTLNAYKGWETQALTMSNLRVLGFHSSSFFETVNSVDEAFSFYQKIESKREELPFEIDGLVFKVNDLELQDALGYTARAPRFAFAWKFAAQKAYTKLKAIHIQVGRTGVLTPVAELEPVSLGGVMVSSASLHNEDEITKLDVRIDDTVLVQRAGDVIPKVIEVDKSKRAPTSLAYVFPHSCPVCHTKAFREEGDAAWYCLNLACPQMRIRAIQHFVSKAGLDIDGVGPKWIERLISANTITSVADLFKLTEKELLQFENVKEKSALNFLDSLEEAKKKASLQRLIAALGIRHIGEQTALSLAQKYKNIDTIMDVARNRPSELLHIQDIGEQVAQSLNAFFLNEENCQIIKELQSFGINPSQEVVMSESDILLSKKVLFTGTLSRPRSFYEALVEKHGGQKAQSVSKNLDILVVGENAGSKLEKAQKLNITLYTEDEFLALIKE